MLRKHCGKSRLGKAHRNQVRHGTTSVTGMSGSIEATSLRTAGGSRLIGSTDVLTTELKQHQLGS